MSDRIPVLVTTEFTDELLDSFRAVSERIALHYYPARSVEDVPADVWAQAEVLYTSSVVPDPEEAPRLRWIQTHSAGVDHLIDQPIIRSENVTVTSASGIHATTMAEYAFMMMLALGHRLLTAIRLQSEAEWASGSKRALLVPQELRGSTLGIVGYGAIGREIARLANAFGMNVLAMKRNVLEPAEDSGYTLPGTGDPAGAYFSRLYPPEALCTMVRDCDFVVVVTPLTESTRNMFGEEAFASMKQTAYLINIGRGGVVDEDALRKALQTGAIAGAALDVFDAEPLPEDSPLWRLPNLIITPHIAGISVHYNEKAAALFVENLSRYVSRRDLLNVVHREYGY
jgi:phosphoglycerate dehydrogenase-like enzyme